MMSAHPCPSMSRCSLYLIMMITSSSTGSLRDSFTDSVSSNQDELNDSVSNADKKLRKMQQVKIYLLWRGPEIESTKTSNIAALLAD